LKGFGSLNGTLAIRRFQSGGSNRIAYTSTTPSYAYTNYYTSTTTRYTSTTTTTTSTTTTTTATFGFCKMIMYDQTYFRGPSVELTGDVNNLVDLAFDNEVSSVKIEGDCCWTLYTDSNFQGVSIQLNVGEYQSPTEIKDIFKKASSARATC
jgi:hypothetical protein